MLIVHVALLGEGTEVWRPVPARRVGVSTYELFGIVPNQEEWQFLPGQVVACEERVLPGGQAHLIALRLANKL
jgi:hypothetical protein